MKTDELFAQITDALLVKMEAGKLPWHKPWSAETAAGKAQAAADHILQAVEQEERIAA